MSAEVLSRSFGSSGGTKACAFSPYDARICIVHLSPMRTTSIALSRSSYVPASAAREDRTAPGGTPAPPRPPRAPPPQRRQRGPPGVGGPPRRLRDLLDRQGPAGAEQRGLHDPPLAHAATSARLASGVATVSIVSSCDARWT